MRVLGRLLLVLALLCLLAAIPSLWGAFDGSTGRGALLVAGICALTGLIALRMPRPREGSRWGATGYRSFYEMETVRLAVIVALGFAFALAMLVAWALDL